MDRDFWEQRWQQRDIGFHQPHVHEQLKKLWPPLNLPRGSAVFVPMAGKSRDMIWLATQGHRIIGVELSDIAVREFFTEGGQTPARTSVENFEISSAGPFSLYCGDFFDMRAEALSDVAAVYDRAALIALPATLRKRYAETLARILPRDAIIFLIGLDYPEHEISGPPFSVARQEIEQPFWRDVRCRRARSARRACCQPNLQKRGRHPAPRDDIPSQASPSRASGMKPLVLVAAVALIDDDKRVLIAKRPEGKPMAGFWEFPGGKIEPGETPEDALVREIKEELGIELCRTCLAPFSFASHAYEHFHLLMPLYICRTWDGEIAPREGQTVEWVRAIAPFPLSDAAGRRAAHSLAAGFFGLGFKASARRTCADPGASGFC